MKKLILFIILSALSYRLSAQDNSQLTPLSYQMNLGDMVFMQSATYSIELRNTSNEPVEIRSVDTGCGCTTASFTKGLIQPFASAQVSLTFDCKQLGHFQRDIRVFSRSKSMVAVNPDSTTYTDFIVKGVVVKKKVNYSGDYPYKMGTILSASDNIEFDDVNQGQKPVQEIQVMNPNGQNVQPVLLRLPSYLSAEMIPATLQPQQKGIMRVTLNSNNLPDFGLNQTTVYLGRNSADKVSADKAITVSAVLLPPAVSKDDVNRPYAPKIVLSRDYIDMSGLQNKSKYQDEITISNTGRKPLEIQKLQFFTTGMEVYLSNRTIEPGSSARLEVTCKEKDLKKLRVRPRILMITNDPDRQKVLIEVKNGTSRE